MSQPVDRDENRVPPGVGTMSIVRWGLVLAMGIAAALSIAYATGALAKLSRGAKGQPERANTYYCPMHPSVVADHPGECPICSMTLVRKPEGRSVPQSQPAGAASMARLADARPVPDLAEIDLSADRIQLIGMRTAKVERAGLGDSLRAVGVIAANERGLSEVSVRFSGWVQKLMVSETGQRVTRGQVLANIYSPDVLRAEQEYLTARRWDAQRGGGGAAGGPFASDPPAAGRHGDSNLGASLQGGSVAADARHRLELLGVAATEIDAMAKRGTVGDSVPVRSPSSGYIMSRSVVLGAAIQAGAPLFQVADLSKVWFWADVFEQDASRIRVGQKAVLELTAYAGERFTGRVQFISPALNTPTRTMRVRLEFANKTGAAGVKLRPGMYGNVALELPSASGLVIPAEALVDTGQSQYVFIAKPGGHFEPRLVRVGGRAGAKVQIAEGVAAGETVVTTGNFLLDSESRLRAAIDGQPALPVSRSGGGDSERPSCASDFDAARFPDKARACLACERQHRGMGSMAEDCKSAIEKPWK